MDSIWIRGGNQLNGDIPISGAKNAALTLLPCALLTDEKLTLGNLPRLADVDTFGHLLNQLGVSTSVAGVKKGEFGRRMTLQAKDIASTVAPYDMVRKMRASVLVLGPMLARAGESALFVGATGRRLAPREVQRRIKRWAALAGLAVDVHPHMLRHSFASHVLQSSGDLRAVQEMLGHASIASTQVYTHLDFQHLARVYDAAHPRARRAKPKP